MTPLSFSPFRLDARGLCLASLLFCVSAAPSAAEDWPEILGPGRNGRTIQLPMKPEKWPSTLKPVWEVEVGAGYAGPAIVEDTVFLPHRKGNLEVLTAYDLGSGRKIWQSSWKTSYRGRIHPDEGPRCVPCVQGDRILCYGAGGDLVCFNLQSGAELWNRPLRKEYDADDGYFGAGSSPLAIGEIAIVCVGGKRGGVVAVDIKTGETRWTATDYEASYSSPVAFEAAGGKQLLLCVMRLNVVLLDVKTGEVLSDLRFGSRGPTVNAATPIALDDFNRKFLLTASYNVGTLVTSVDSMGMTEGYRNQRLLASQYNSPVRIGDLVFGVSGREDVGDGKLRAIDPVKQEVLWEIPDFGTAHLIGFDEQVLAMDLDGRVVLFNASGESYQQVAETSLPTSTYRSLPALSGRYLVVRGSDGASGGRLIRVDLH